ncbi:hypothetical protein EV215_2062 [Hypnocyclicus thermotrophus]|uniref:Outer membrane protein beta-barrel domain-containing protein n=1 Tax=Hypnocyclicus thermotrophus TaxID=1627895 RepID=A0AA46DX96_9FUSO|nr:hypothetical protein [Hypnocyclicus thermotrophus]TDT67014.1 hypothetical protein EV215_2062 [Hypnocyclicus thermotrophus]
MKKLLFIACFLITSMLAFAGFEIKGGTYFNGSDDIKTFSGSPFDLDAGYTARGEFYIANEGFSIGYGAAYQSIGKHDITTTKLSYIDAAIPVYLSARYATIGYGSWMPYIKGNIGYSFYTKGKDLNSTDLIKPGLYYSGGIGANINDFLIEVTYEISKGEFKILPNNYDFSVSRISLEIGYNFSGNY